MPTAPEQPHGRKARRNTPQRRIILEELRGMKSHPTASELYETVRKRLPRISLGTVYRNLEVLHQDGQINKLSWACGEARFDAHMEEHLHVRCRMCGAIHDLPADSLEGHPAFDPRKLEPSSVETEGFLIEGIKLEYSGLCPECRNQSTKEN